MQNHLGFGGGPTYEFSLLIVDCYAQWILFDLCFSIWYACDNFILELFIAFRAMSSRPRFLHRVVIYVKDSKSCAQGSRCYELLRILDDMNISRSYDLRPLDVMTNSRLRMTWMTLGCEPMTLNAMNSLGLCMKWMSLDHELRTLDAVNNS